MAQFGEASIHGQLIRKWHGTLEFRRGFLKHMSQLCVVVQLFSKECKGYKQISSRFRHLTAARQNVELNYRMSSFCNLLVSVWIE